MVYSPERKSMYCPHCEGIESGQKTEGTSEETCANCGAPIRAGRFASSTRCEHCGNYIVFDKKVQGSYEPNLIVPFKIGKEGAKEILKKEVKKRAFTPAGFLSEATLDKMEGIYVPFWLYDYLAHYDYVGEGTKVRSWRSGDKEYTETSYYRVVRELDIDFDKIPADASIAMDDGIMDLMEPYDYKELEGFQDKYISGFLSEYFNDDAETLEPRAIAKAKSDAEALLQEQLGGYSTLRAQHKRLDMDRLGFSYALLPVWVYTYSYRNQKFPFYVNGQTGKVIGKTPMSVPKLAGYSATAFAFSYLIINLMFMIAAFWR